MIPNKTLPTGKNTDDYINKPKVTAKNELEAVQNLIEEWELVKAEYSFLETDSQTYPQLHAMMGAIKLVESFINDLRELEKDIRRIEGLR